MSKYCRQIQNENTRERTETNSEQWHWNGSTIGRKKFTSIVEISTSKDCQFNATTSIITSATRFVSTKFVSSATTPTTRTTTHWANNPTDIFVCGKSFASHRRDSIAIPSNAHIWCHSDITVAPDDFASAMSNHCAVSHTDSGAITIRVISESGQNQIGRWNGISKPFKDSGLSPLRFGHILNGFAQRFRPCR